jgi:charged multivesicular body protein 4A/B
LETQCFQLESAVSTADAFQAMSAGTQTLQQLRTTTTVEQVDDIMMDIQEEIQIAQQVNTAIGQGFDLTTITTTEGQQILSDDDLLRELEELQQQPQSANDLKSLKTQLDIAENGRKFNTTSQPAAAVCGSELTNREAKDFRRLQAELAM